MAKGPVKVIISYFTYIKDSPSAINSISPFPSNPFNFLLFRVVPSSSPFPPFSPLLLLPPLQPNYYHLLLHPFFPSFEAAKGKADEFPSFSASVLGVCLLDLHLILRSPPRPSPRPRPPISPRFRAFQHDEEKKKRGGALPETGRSKLTFRSGVFPLKLTPTSDCDPRFQVLYQRSG